MLHLHKPTREELRFRQELLSDPSTISYNHAYGGTIVFPPARWEGWAAHWLDAADGARFYRYLAREDGIFVGETAYHYDEAQRIYICDIIVHARYRHQGYGREGLRLLCDAARAQGVTALYDDIAADNPSVALFLACGFEIAARTADIVLVCKHLQEDEKPVRDTISSV